MSKVPQIVGAAVAFVVALTVTILSSSVIREDKHLFYYGYYFQMAPLLILWFNCFVSYSVGGKGNVAWKQWLYVALSILIALVLYVAVFVVVGLSIFSEDMREFRS